MIHRPCGSSPWRRLAACVALVTILAACGSTERSPSPALVTGTSAPTASAASLSPPTAAATASATASAAPPTPRPVPRPAEWATTDSLREALVDPQAVTLGDGRVVVVGQRANRNGQPTATIAELWDPATDRWRPTAGLEKIRTEFALVALQDGRALVIGGRNASDQSFSSAWAFDPSTEHWSKVGLMDRARAAPSAAVLPDGRVLVAGGYFARSPDYGSVQPSITLAAYRPGLTTIARPPLADVDTPPSGTAMATVELFDPRTGTWSKGDSMRYARAGAAVAMLSDGRVLIVGSTPTLGDGSVSLLDPRALSTAEVFDPETGRISFAGELPAVHVDAPAWVGRYLPEGVGWGEDIRTGTLVALDDGGALLVGHGEWGPHIRSASSTSYRFDPVDKTWSEMWQPWVSVFDEDTGQRSWTSPDRDFGGAVVVKLGDDRVLVAGGGGTPGFPDSPIVRTASLYDPATDVWTKAPRMPSARTGGVAVPLDDGSILVLGGSRDGEESARSTVLFLPGH